VIQIEDQRWMSRGGSKVTARALGTGGVLGGVYAFFVWLVRGGSSLAPVAAATLVAAALVILHDSGVRTRRILISVAITAALAGLYVLILWLSLRNWQPEW
jgi:mannose/fructose/N-acetylgalactosamine-specific phosphotransferase system component IIC